MKNLLNSLAKILIFSALSFTFISQSASAENVLETPDYIIHYNAFNSTAIDATAAKQNNLIRSKYTGMLNIAVFKKQADDSTVPVKSINRGTVENLLRQQQSLTFKTIVEGSAKNRAIYYIASFRFADEEQMNFAIELQPDPNQAPIKLTLTQVFYVQ
ncbi:MAG: hypothetical protein OFPII_29350 [Osedax symbiont Rs1]|nr:MAG: hypothetical protein OFPII_29350 [Osedax symbiont Rs1]